jgi:hypothetical protein
MHAPCLIGRALNPGGQTLYLRLCLYHLNGTRNSRVSGHGIRIVLYALVRLVTVVVLLK